jgi:precorrin-6B methylase 2
MKSRYVLCRSAVLVWLFVLLAAVALPAAQTTEKEREFTPQEGQAGKDVIWLPTANTLVDKMLELAQLTPQDFLIDLGSGDGRTVIAAAQRGARARGIEYDPNMVELSKRNAAKAGVADRAEFVKADLFESDFSQATVITMFLLPEINLKLRPQILNLKPGTRIVSNTFTMGDWQADETVTVEAGCTTYCTALLWIVPAKVEGQWTLPQGRLTLTQQFQTVSGTLRTNGNTVPIANGQLRGDQISFTAGGVDYTGRVTGTTIQGERRASGRSERWTATRVTRRS